MNSPICLFDSGSGGLTVLKKLISSFPSEHFIYLADLANVPFGDKSKDSLKKSVDEIIEWLLKFNPKLLIMACNTSSTLFFNDYKQTLKVPVFGMIESVAKEIASSTFSKVSVWATTNTVQNHGYKYAIQELNSKIEVEEVPCPKLVPLIEDLSIISEEKEKILTEYIKKTSNNAEALIWGCTHYPLIEEDFKKLFAIKTIDPTDSLIKQLRDILPTQNTGSTPNITLYTTAMKEKFQQFAKYHLCYSGQIKQISISKSLA
ncbi:MAG: glutamate racemase [Candidatus Melainabacteria bacterium]|nr:glutamate racemase [Candidatus Melainabacteria bacterium]